MYSCKRSDASLTLTDDTQWQWDQTAEPAASKKQQARSLKNPDHLNHDLVEALQPWKVGGEARRPGPALVSEIIYLQDLLTLPTSLVITVA